MRALNQLLLLAFFALAGVGYIYLYPRQAGFLTKTDVYRFYLGPHLDKLFALGGQNSITVGYLVEADGEITHRPATELVSMPAYDGQRFGRGTLVSTGDGANATLALFDNSQLRLEPNSTILLEAPNEEGEVSSITLKIVTGGVTARKSANSQIKIKLVTPKGTTKVLAEEAVAVVAPRKLKTASAPDALRDLGAETEEFIGPADRPLAEIEKKLTDDKKAKLAEIQSRLDAAAAELERTRQLAMTPSPVASPTAAVASTDKVVKPKLVAPVRHGKGARVPASVFVPEAIAATPATRSQTDENSTPQTVAVRKRDPGARWQRPPQGNDISEAYFAARAGKKNESSRYLARSLTQQGYASNETFADSTRIALDSLLEGYVGGGNGKLALQTLKNVENAYPSDLSARSWATSWRRKLADAGYEVGERVPANSP